MKFFLYGVTLLVWVGMGVWLFAQAAEEATVSATVTVLSLSVSVDDGSVPYGILAAGATNDTFSIPDRQVVENDGNDAIDVNIRGGTTDSWDLTTSAGTDEFVHRFASDDAGDDLQALTDDQTLFTDNLAAAATRALDLEIQVPIATTETGLQTADVTLTAVEP